MWPRPVWSPFVTWKNAYARLVWVRPGRPGAIATGAGPPSTAEVPTGKRHRRVVPIADIRLTFLTTAVEPSQSSSLGDGSHPLAAIRAVAACTSHTRAFTDFAYAIM